MGEKIITFLKFFIAACVFHWVIMFANGCKSTAQYGAGVGGVDYLRPDSIEAADYAIRERIGELERQIAAARITVGEIRASGEAIRELSRRSARSVQEIIGKMEALVLWIDWATGRIQYLESLLEDQVQDTALVDPQAGISMSERAAITADKVTAKLGR